MKYAKPFKIFKYHAYFLQRIKLYPDICPEHLEYFGAPPVMIMREICDANCMILCHTTRGNDEYATSIFIHCNIEMKFLFPKQIHS